MKLKEVDKKIKELNNYLKLEENYSQKGNDNMVHVKHIICELHQEIYRQAHVIENLKIRIRKQ